MILPRLASLAAIAVALLITPVFTPGASRAPAAETNRVYARFEVFGFAGFHVLTNRTRIEEIGDRYAITMDLDTRGLASVFVDLTSHSEVHGEFARGAARPEAYRADVRRNGYGACLGEFEEFSNGVSAAVLDHRARPAVVLNIWGPSQRVTERRLATLGRMALHAAHEISLVME